MKAYTQDLLLGWNQLCVVYRACETLPRAYMGQIQTVLEQCDGPRSRCLTDDIADRVSNILTGLNGHAYHGIRHRDLPEASRLAWDIYQVVRVPIMTRRSTDEENSGFFRAQSPFGSSYTDPLPEIEDVPDTSGTNLWKLSLTDGHANALAKACSVFADVQKGDFVSLVNLVVPVEGYAPSSEERTYAQDVLHALAIQVYGPDAPLDLTDRNIPTVARISADIALAVDEPEAVACREPLSDEPLPTIMRVERLPADDRLPRP